MVTMSRKHRQLMDVFLLLAALACLLPPCKGSHSGLRSKKLRFGSGKHNRPIILVLDNADSAKRLISGILGSDVSEYEYKNWNSAGRSINEEESGSDENKAATTYILRGGAAENKDAEIPRMRQYRVYWPEESCSAFDRCLEDCKRGKAAPSCARDCNRLYKILGICYLLNHGSGSSAGTGTGGGMGHIG